MQFQEHETKQWMVEIDPISSGESCQIEILNLLRVFVLEDVLFGDVWFCSGQSNMGWAMLGNVLRQRQHPVVIIVNLNLFL